MARNRGSEGARALLFERLADQEPRSSTELSPFRTHSPEGLKASILRRLQLILNTRATRPRPDGYPLTVLDFGLPDYSSMYGQDPRTQAIVVTEIRRTIEAFEPRLQLSTVQLVPVSTNGRSLQLELAGSIRVEDIVEPVSFTLPLADAGPQEST